MSWLAPVRAALEAAEEPCPFFFRDDDAGWADDRLFEVLGRFAERGVPVDVAVIPAAVTPPLVRDLLARAADGSVHLHQHGYAHVNHESTGRKHEFGPSREAATQTADILTGRLLLLDALGEAVEPIFTPPWNRCSRDTGAAVLAAGLSVLSQDDTAVPQGIPGLQELPVTVDWFAHRKGTRLTLVELGARIAAQATSGGPVGVMLHHELTDDDEQAALDDLLGLLATHPMAACTTMLALAGQPADA